MARSLPAKRLHHTLMLFLLTGLQEIHHHSRKAESSFYPKYNELLFRSTTYCDAGSFLG